jgi:hypothetical protein
MSILDKQNRRPLRAVGGIGLLVVTVIGALSQGGVLVPGFRDNGSGGTSGSSTASLVAEDFENVSPRSWTITGVHFSDPAAVRKLSDVRIIAVGAQPQDTGPSFPEPLHQRLTVSPGQYFDVGFLEKESDCPSQSSVRNAAQEQRLASSPRNHQRSIPAVVTVATPLGTRSIDTTLSMSCGL